MSYQQLTYEQRCQIEALNKSGLTQKEIAGIVGTTQPSISRELKRNTGKKGYRHKQAHNKCLNRRKLSHKPTKMTPKLIALISKQLKEKWSPEQISGWLLEEHEVLLSHEAIYLYVLRDKAAGGDLYTHLRRQGKKYQKRVNNKRSRGQIKNRVSIDERPKIVDSKERIGDWEIDTMIGKGHSGAIVTIVERATMFTLTARVNSKEARAVTDATIKLLKPYKVALHSITADNGKEFAYHEEITKKLGVPVYFAHPYHSWERGLNENTNGLLRQYWPKETDFKNVSHQEVLDVTDSLNDRPRKTLDYKTPKQMMQEYLEKSKL